jgi:hypothetical protein
MVLERPAASTLFTGCPTFVEAASPSQHSRKREAEATALLLNFTPYIRIPRALVISASPLY